MQHWLTELLNHALSDDLSPQMFKKYSVTGYPIATIRSAVATQPGTAILITAFGAQDKAIKPSFDFLNGQTANAIIRQTFERVINRFNVDDKLVIPRTKVFPLKFSPYNFRGIVQSSAEHLSKEVMNRGSENNLFVATKDGFQAWDVNPAGQSGFINQQGVASKHGNDQLKMFENFEKKPVYWSQSELIKHGFKFEIINANP